MVHPQIDVTGYLNLNDTLEAMGLTDLLSPEKADLSGLTDLDAYLSSVRQTARVRVDEEGMEAAAATVLSLPQESAPAEGQTCVMNLNRPFLFVLRCQGMPLLVGIVNKCVIFNSKNTICSTKKEARSAGFLFCCQFPSLIVKNRWARPL